MKVSKWVDFGQEIEIEIGVDDISAALASRFDEVTGQDIDEVPAREIRGMLNTVAQFFKALTDKQIAASFSEPARKTVQTFLAEQTARFAPPVSEPESGEQSK